MEALNSTVCDAVRSHLSACDAAVGMGGAEAWVALVVAVCVLCGETEASAAATRHVHNENELSPSDYLKVGRSLNLMPRYGFLTLSIKVFSHRGDNNWLFRERTVEVFEKNSYWSRPTQVRSATPPLTPPPSPRNTVDPDSRQGQPSTSPTPSQTPRRPYDPHFLIDFCDNMRDLLVAYFDNFYIEGVPEPHRAFTSSISLKTTAQHLGIHPTYLSSEYSFVLVRLFRRSRRSMLDGHLALSGSFKSAVERIRMGSMESVNQFLDQYGTHVITEYEVGDVLYQVYVFGNRTYSDFKNNFAMSQSSENELMRMERYFTPSHALHIGRVKLASGNPQFDETVRRGLLKITIFRIYQSIFMIFKDKDLEKRLEQLDGEVVLGMKLEKITKLLPKSPERHWLGEILDNILSLFYVTM